MKTVIVGGVAGGASGGAFGSTPARMPRWHAAGSTASCISRSYLACRILAGYGFTAYNLAGGYRFYELVMQELAEQR